MKLNKFFSLFVISYFMKKLDMQSLLSKSLKDLVSMRNALKKEYFDMRVKLSLRSLSHTHLISLARKNLARINTAITTLAK